MRGEAVPPVLAASGGGEVRGRWTARPAVPVRLPWLRPVGPPALPRAKWRRTSPKKDVGRTAAASAEGRVPRAEPRAHGSGRAHAWADHIRHTTDWSVDERDRVPRASERRAMRAATTRVSHARILNKKTERSRRHRAPGPGRGGCRGVPSGHMGSHLVFGVAPSLRDPCQGAALACSRGRLEATAAVLTGAASVSTTERLLRMWSAPPVAPLPDLLALPSTSGMTRRDSVLEFHGAERRPLGSALHAPG